jgi:prepilin signal peptidase PulO-like enzyme (type II secretory pathway)
MTKRKMTKGANCIGCHSSTYSIRLPLLSFFFWSLYWLSFFDLRHQIAPLVIFLLVIVLVVILWQKGQSDAVGRRMTTNTMTKRKMTKGAIWCCRSKNDNQYNDGCYSSTYGIRLPLLSFFFWSLYWLSFCDLRHQIVPFVIFRLVIVLFVILRPTASDCPSCHFFFGHWSKNNNQYNDQKKNYKRGNLMP